MRYSAYGVAVHSAAGDTDDDGDVDFTDLGVLLSVYPSNPTYGGTGYDVNYDFDQDGDVDFPDFNVMLNSYSVDLADGQVSMQTISNTVGYCGYLYEPAINRYLARFRWYDAGAGRWLNRDPIGYADGMSLYEYVGSVPTGLVDPFGLEWCRCGSMAFDPDNDLEWDHDLMMFGMSLEISEAEAALDRNFRDILDVAKDVGITILTVTPETALAAAQAWRLAVGPFSYTRVGPLNQPGAWQKKLAPPAQKSFDDMVKGARYLRVIAGAGLVIEVSSDIYAGEYGHAAWNGASFLVALGAGAAAGGLIGGPPGIIIGALAGAVTSLSMEKIWDSTFGQPSPSLRVTLERLFEEREELERRRDHAKEDRKLMEEWFQSLPPCAP